MIDLGAAIVIGALILALAVVCGAIWICNAIDRWPNCQPCEGEAKHHKESRRVH